MKVYQTNEIKNIALLGSSGSGKTTLVEAMLFESGVIKRRGTIAAKNTVSDYFPVEQEYGYSVFSTVFHVEWNNKKLNMIDCPGSDDFVGGTVTALNVTDTAIILLNGQYGVEVGTQNHFRYTEKLNKPVIFLVNQLDNDKCDYDNILEQLKEAYGSKVVPIQYPINTGPEFNSLIDVLLMKKYSWKPEGGAPIIEDIPAEEMDKAMEWHKALVEAAARLADRRRNARWYPQRTCRPWNVPRILCMCRQRHGSTPPDGVLRQRCSLCFSNAKSDQYSRKRNSS